MWNLLCAFVHILLFYKHFKNCLFYVQISVLYESVCYYPLCQENWFSVLRKCWPSQVQVFCMLWYMNSDQFPALINNKLINLDLTEQTTEQQFFWIQSCCHENVNTASEQNTHYLSESECWLMQANMDGCKKVQFNLLNKSRQDCFPKSYWVPFL